MTRREKINKKLTLLHDDSILGASLRVSGFPRITDEDLEYMKTALKVGVPTICISEKDFLKKFIRQNASFDDYVDNLPESGIISIYEQFERANDLMKFGLKSPQYKDQIRKIISIINP